MAHDDRVVKSTRLRPIVVLEAVVLAGWLADRLAGPCRLRGKRSLSMKMENRFHTAIARENNTIAPAAAAAPHTIAEFPPFAVRDIAAMIWWITHECRDCFFFIERMARFVHGVGSKALGQLYKINCQYI